MTMSTRGSHTGERLSRLTGRGADVATNELALLASAVERQTTADGVYDTAVPGLTLYRSSAPSAHDAVVDEPCLVYRCPGLEGGASRRREVPPRPRRVAPSIARPGSGRGVVSI